MNDLLIPEELNAATIFQPSEMDPLIEKITKEVRAFKDDVTTAKGRKSIAAMAYKVSRSKTFLDEMGKDLGEERRLEIKAINNVRAKMRDQLEELRDEVRDPLTKFEEAEQERIAKHEDNIREIVEAGEHATAEWETFSLECVNDRLSEIERQSIGEDFWDEYAPQALDARDNAISKIKAALERRKTYDAEQSELARLRQETADREAKDREDAIAREAEKKATADAEAKITEERERADKAERAVEDTRLDAEKKKVQQAEEILAVADQAKKDQDEAVQRERDRIAGEEKAKEDAERKRAADKEHRRKINQAAVNALMEIELTKTDAKNVIEAIVVGGIPNVAIRY